jgi:hypothetical protein
LQTRDLFLDELVFLLQHDHLLGEVCPSRREPREVRLTQATRKPGSRHRPA